MTHEHGAFSADWLALRAAADAEARDPATFAAAAAALGEGLAVDLGCGAGAMAAALADAAPAARFRLVDGDPALLNAAAAQLGGRVERTVEADLATADLAPILSGARLVAASALYDLVSSDWIDRLIAATPDAAAVYAALTCDGRQMWAPTTPNDTAVLAAFDRHQRGDKGFGPALGPAAATVLADRLRADGRPVRLAPSDWRLAPPVDAALIRALAQGSAAAARELGVEPGAFGTAPRSDVRIGHLDVFAGPKR